MSFRFNRKGECPDVAFWIVCGMTDNQARAFAQALDDKPVAGMTSGKLAGLCFRLVNRYAKLHNEACGQVERMLKDYREQEPHFHWKI